MRRLLGPFAIAAAVLCAAGSRPASASEPRLILPGGHVVQPGQLVELRWSQAESVSELEILLSTDGGRHYSRCISPRLDPGRCAFVWRVPDLGNRSLRMRIRYNRGGREIEGAPTPRLLARGAPAGTPEPLALPPLGAEPAPRPSGGRESSSFESRAGAIGTREERSPVHHPMHRPLGIVVAPAATSPITTLMLHRFRPPRSAPLRA